MLVMALTGLLSAPLGLVSQAGRQVPAQSNQEDEPDAALNRARALLDSSRAAAQGRNPTAARALTRDAIELLLARTAGAPREDEEVLLFDLSKNAHDLGDLESARDGWARVLQLWERRLPADDRRLAAVRLDVAVSLSQLGDPRSASALLEQAVTALEGSATEEDPQLLRARANLAVAWMDLGRLAEARALQEAILAIRERVLPEDDYDVQLARQALANTLHEQEEFDAARRIQEKVHEVLESTLPEGDLGIARIRESLSSTLEQLGRSETALPLAESAVRDFERTLPDDHPELVQARHGLAIILRGTGELERARALLESVVAARSRRLPPEDSDLLSAREHLGVVLEKLGDFEAALATQEEVLRIRTRRLPAGHFDLEASRLNLATVLARVGRLHRARELQELALRGWSAIFPEDHPYILAARQNLALTTRMLGDVAGACALAEQVLEARIRTQAPDHPDLLDARQMVATLRRLQGEPRSALELQSEVVRIREQRLPPHDPRLAMSRSNLANIWTELGDHEQARELQELALGGLAATRDADHPDLARVRLNLSETLEALGELGAAKEQLALALETYRRARPPGDADRISALRRSAWNRARLGEDEQAVALAAELVTELGQALSTHLGRSSPREIEEFARAEGSALSMLLDLPRRGEAFAALDDPAFQASESLRGVGLLSGALAREAGQDPELAELSRQEAAAAAELAHRVRTDSDRDAIDEARRRLDEIRRERSSRSAAPARTDSLLAEPTVARLGAVLGDHVALVAFRVYSHMDDGGPRPRPVESLMAYVLREGGQLTRVEVGPLSEVLAAVEGWRSAIMQTSGQGSGRGVGVGDAAMKHDPESAGTKVRELVFDPWERHLEGALVVVLVPDDALFLVPFDALPYRGATLGERWRFQLRISSRELLRPERTLFELGGLVALGGASFDEGPRNGAEPGAAGAEAADARASHQPACPLLRGSPWEHGFAELPGTVEEVRAIAAVYEACNPDAPAPTLLEGRAAARFGIEASAPRARFLHLATHGWTAAAKVDPSASSASEEVRATSPMLLSGLALAGANLPADELGRWIGLATAEEISTWELGSCELAVLSACETSLGEPRGSGQGLASLQKAFHMAGARSVISSLWKVDDAATRRLMEVFYSKLWKDRLGKSEALWQAKQVLRAEGCPLRDWAGWVLTGDPD